MHFTEKHIAVVSNPLSQKAVATGKKIAGLLFFKKIRCVHFTDQWPQNFSDFSEAWIVGGDGTLNFFINRYPTTAVPLSVFKGGTGNDFHWMLYGNISIEQQIEQVLGGKPKPLDAAKCNERYFINSLGIGFDAKVSQSLSDKKKLNGKTSYLLAVLKNILFYREFYCTIYSDAKTIEQQCLMITIANGKRIGGGFHVAPLASVDDGLLDLSIVGKLSPLKRIRYLPMIEKGKHTPLPFVDYHHTQSAQIISPQVVPAHVDGEYFLADVFSVKCLPQKFPFIV